MEREYPLLMQPFLLEEDIPQIAQEDLSAVESLQEQGLITDDEAAILRDPVAQAELYARFEELGLLDDYVILLDTNEADI